MNWLIIDTGMSAESSVASHARFSIASSAWPGRTSIRTISGGVSFPDAWRSYAQRTAALAAPTYPVAELAFIAVASLEYLRSKRAVSQSSWYSSSVVRDS